MSIFVFSLARTTNYAILSIFIKRLHNDLVRVSPSSHPFVPDFKPLKRVLRIGVRNDVVFNDHQLRTNICTI